MKAIMTHVSRPALSCVLVCLIFGGSLEFPTVTTPEPTTVPRGTSTPSTQTISITSTPGTSGSQNGVPATTTYPVTIVPTSSTKPIATTTFAPIASTTAAGPPTTISATSTELIAKTTSAQIASSTTAGPPTTISATSTESISTTTSAPIALSTETTRGPVSESTPATEPLVTSGLTTGSMTTPFCENTTESSGNATLTVVPRADWGAKAAANPLTNLAGPVTYVIVHHTVTKECKCKETCSAVVKSIQNYHMAPKPNGKGWWDIGYNFLIGGDGNAYEGRGWDKQGAHAGAAWNADSVGIAMIGDFTNKMPTKAALTALDDLIAFGVQNGKLKANYEVKGHKDVSQTLCPGNKFHNDHVKKMKNYKP